MSDTDPDLDHLSARLAAVERALTDRDCDCAHESFSPPEPPVPASRRSDHRRPTDDELRAALVAVCEYVLARERATDPDEHAEAVRAALDTLTDAPSPAETSTGADPGAAGETPREWLERVAATVFG